MKPPIYITFKKPKKGQKLITSNQGLYFLDIENKTGEIMGIEILDYKKLEIDGIEWGI